MAARDATKQDDDDVVVSAFQSSPDRTVFTEDENPDGWISTDVTVEVEP